MDVVKVDRLHKNYYQYKVFMKGRLLTQALKNVSFSVRKGDFFGLLGKNGAGKSTLLKILTTNLEKTSGKVLINGYDLDSGEREVKESISWMFGVDYSGIGWSSIEKNLRLAASFLGLSKRETEQRIRELLHRFDLYKHRDMDVWRMSTGMQGRYSLCVAMLKDPEVLFLDEPLLGLDFEAKEQLRDLLRELNEEGTTIIYTDQQLREVEKLCKNVVVIDHGNKMYDGSVARLKEKYRDADVIMLRCRCASPNAVLQELKRTYRFISDFEIVDSRDGIHDIKLYTTVDGAEVLMKVGTFLQQKHVIVEQLNAGMLDLEDVFKKFLRKDTVHEQAQHLLNYHIAGEKPREEHAHYLRHKHHAVRGAACQAFLNYQDVDRVLKEMLMLTKNMQIESLRVIGDAKMNHLVGNVKQSVLGKDKELRLHLALALGKLGDVEVVDTLVELLLDARTCSFVLEHLQRLDHDVLRLLRERVLQLTREDQQFLLYQIQKQKKSEELRSLLHLSAARQPLFRKNYLRSFALSR